MRGQTGFSCLFGIDRHIARALDQGLALVGLQPVKQLPCGGIGGLVCADDRVEGLAVGVFAGGDGFEAAAL